MKAYKINSETRTIEPIQINDWREIAPKMNEKCDLFEVPVILDNRDSIYIDEEGLYHDYQTGFTYRHDGRPFVGNGILLGSNDEGESCDVQTPIEEFAKDIIWLVKRPN